MIAWRGVGVGIALGLSAAAAVSCGSNCGLGFRGRVPLSGDVPCCGASSFRDVPLSVKGDTEFQLASTAFGAAPALVDAFLVPTSCGKLFDGPYPGATPLCQIYLGPVVPGKVTSLVKLPAGTYRVWFQGYASNTTGAQYLIDLEIWNTDCRSPLLQ